MKLTYRGVSYESTQKPASVPAVDLRYRGANYRLNQVAKNENLNAILKYRGAAYTLQPTVQTATVTPAAAPAVSAASHLSIEEQARFLTLNHHRAVKNRQQSMLRRSAAEAGLSAHIANYWNHIQGKVHPSFWMSYDRSHTALS